MACPLVKEIKLTLFKAVLKDFEDEQFTTEEGKLFHVSKILLGKMRPFFRREMWFWKFEVVAPGRIST